MELVSLARLPNHCHHSPFSSVVDLASGAHLANRQSPPLYSSVAYQISSARLPNRHHSTQASVWEHWAAVEPSSESLLYLLEIPSSKSNRRPNQTHLRQNQQSPPSSQVPPHSASVSFSLSSFSAPASQKWVQSPPHSPSSQRVVAEGHSNRHRSNRH